MTRTRPYKVEVTLTGEEREVLRALARKARLTQSQLIRSVLISQELTMDELEDPTQEIEKQKVALAIQERRFDESQRTVPLTASGEPISEQRKFKVQVMVTAAEKNAFIERAEILHMSVSDLIRRSALYGKIEKTNFDIGAAERIHHELLKEGTNLNQLMYFLNANGIGGYDKRLAEKVAKRVWASAERCDRFIESMEKRFGFDYIPLEPDDDDSPDMQ